MRLAWQRLRPTAPPIFSKNISRRICANLRIRSGGGWGGQLPHLPPPPVATLMFVLHTDLSSAIFLYDDIGGDKDYSIIGNIQMIKPACVYVYQTVAHSVRWLADDR